MINRRYASGGIEPPLSEVLSDPIVHAVMRRDGVTREELIAVTQRAASAIKARNAGDSGWRVTPIRNTRGQSSSEAHADTATHVEISYAR